MQIEHEWFSHERGRPEHADCASRDGTELDGIGRVGSPPIQSLRSDKLLRDLNERQMDRP